MDETKYTKWQAIVDHLNGSMPAEDENNFLEWLSAHPENQGIFENLKTIYEQQDRFNRFDQIDLHKGWKNVEKSIKEIHRSNTIIFSFLKYAAIFIFGMATLFAWNLITNSTKTEGTFVYHTVVAPNGSKAEVKLGDGTKITLNGGSQLTYPEKFSRDERKVTLSGEAYFDVERDERRPFYLSTNDLKIKVLGTSFNVKAYPEDNTVETFVTSGKVEVEVSGKYRQEQKVYLSKNEKAVFIKRESNLNNQDQDKMNVPKNDAVTEKLKSGRPQLVITEKTDAEEETSWRQNKFIFKEEPMESLITKLERWYGVEIELKKDGLKKYHFTGTFEQETIEQVMNAMAYSIPIRWEKNKKKILISAKN